ncbi:MAG TPA: hypothetical protein VNA29_08800 [Sphingomicrobium sp.]|nr:hypothetical protein [Sphingomicrobium sp.]
MRSLLFALPPLLTAAPLAAQTAPARPAPAQPQRAIPAEIGDPALADKLTRASGVLAKVLMDMPVGELEAAMEGRQPTAAERRKRVRDEIGPEEERALMSQVAASGPQMRAMQKALVATLPAIMKSLAGVERELESAVSNLPDPTYPKR